MLSGYDAWKTRVPDYYESEELPEDACEHCRGTGEVWRSMYLTCSECRGSGRAPVDDPEDVIPAEIDDDLDEDGNPPPHGNENT